MQLWSGQAYPLCDEKSSEDIVRELVEEAKALLGAEGGQ